MQRVHVFVYGIVQGVFFRHNTKKLADELGLKGFVRNISGGVEAVFEGPDDAIKKMLVFCKNGPSGARVDRLEVKREKYKEEFNNFEIRY